VIKIYRSYDLNTILQISSISIVMLSILSYFWIGGNQYVNGYTVIFLLMFGFLNFIILGYEKHKNNNDPFILLLTINIIVFYMLRVLSLIYFPWSSVLRRNNCSSNDINNALVFIFLCVISIFLGLILVRNKGIERKIGVRNQINIKSSRTIILFVFALIFTFTFLSKLYFTSGMIGVIAGYLKFLVDIQIFLLFILCFFVLYYKKVPKLNKNIFFLLLLSFILLQTVIGNKGGIYILFSLVLIVAMQLKGRLKLKINTIIKLIAVLIIAIYLFAFANYIRDNYYKRQVTNESYANVAISFFDLKNFKMIEDTTKRVLDRIGYLDTVADFIANFDKYNKIINVSYYFKSIIDHLTPGFNFFSTPRASNVLYCIYNDLYIPNRIEIFQERDYHSDIFTLYGEFYILFHKYFALIICFIISYLFKKIYLSINSKNEFSNYLYKSLVLFFFSGVFLNSFGLDWSIVRVIQCIISMNVLIIIYKLKVTTHSK